MMPCKSLLDTGLNLDECCRVQLEMCEVKVQALEVVAALEEVMKENNLNLELASIAPTILVSGSVLWGETQADWFNSRCMRVAH